MAASTLYIGESDGARVLAVGRGVITQVGTAYQMTLETWPVSPGGPSGDVMFRIITVAFECVGGYDVSVTPIVDGVEQTTQTFTGGDTGRVVVQAHLAKRGTTIAARFETNSRAGTLSVHDITYAFVPLRTTP